MSRRLSEVFVFVFVIVCNNLRNRRFLVVGFESFLFDPAVKDHKHGQEFLAISQPSISGLGQASSGTSEDSIMLVE
jgi:hypothetical protein